MTNKQISASVFFQRVPRGAWTEADRRPPSRCRLSSCYLRCPWIRRRPLFFSEHRALPCIPGTQPRTCCCVCVFSGRRRARRDGTERGAGLQSGHKETIRDTEWGREGDEAAASQRRLLPKITQVDYIQMRPVCVCISMQRDYCSC